MQSAISDVKSQGLSKNLKGLENSLPQASKTIMPKVVGAALTETDNPKEVIEEIAKVDKKAANNPLIFAQKYLGIDEKDPTQQATIKGFINKAVPGFVKKASEVSQDAKAWCAAFVNNVLNEGDFGGLDYESDKYNLIRARKYAKIGEEVPNISEGKPGDIMVVKDLTGTNGYHVAFYSGKKNGKHLMLGGNQDGRYVNVKEIDEDSLKIVSVRRLKNIEDIDEDSLKLITSSKHYSSTDKKSNLR